VTPEARAARERKQKIFVAVGGIFLLAMLAIQLPKLLGGSGTPVAATTTVTDGTVQPAQPGAVTPIALPGASTATGAGPAVPGKLTSFGAFGTKKKSPFVQLVVTGDVPAGDGKPTDNGKKPAEGGAGSKEFSLGEKQAAPAVTVVSVNGVRQTLVPGTAFPAADPVFVLIDERPASKSLVVGVVGGQYAGGSKTTKLTVGKPLTLVNTATGAKYRISVVSVGSGDAPEKASKPK
jgi:hypothetical protein